MSQHVIIGNGTAANAAAEMIRKHSSGTTVFCERVVMHSGYDADG